jgi:glutamyl/glutaminyl-tRNA synthetase
MLLGWNPGTDKEIFSIDELIEQFDINKIQKGGAIFDIVKLNWINKEYIKKMSDDDFKKIVFEFLPDKLKNKNIDNLLPIIKERIEKFGDIKNMNEAGEFDYYFDNQEYEADALIWKNSNKETTIKHLNQIIKIIDGVSEFNSNNIKENLWDYASGQGRGDVLWPMRYALSGREKSPDPFTLSEILGKEKTIERLKIAIEKLS